MSVRKTLREFSPLHRAQDTIIQQLGRSIAMQRMDQLFLMGQIATMNLPRGPIDNIQQAQFRVFSQNSEDGIIQYLISKIPGIPRTFVEFGVGDYLESNTLFLLMNNRWRGLIMDTGTMHMAVVQREGFDWRYGLKAKRTFVTTDNINALFQEAGFTGEIGLLSIDVDSTDWYLWEALTVANPAIVICEYNRNFPHDRPITISAKGFTGREAAHPSLFYYGTSIGALAVLAERKGYRFVGVESNQRNAFFVREDLAADLPKASPSADMVDHETAIVMETIKGMTVLNVASGREEII
jgi:hypothetical protein